MTPPALDPIDDVNEDDIREAWSVLSTEERVSGFQLLPRTEAEDLFLELDSRDQAELLLGLPGTEQRLWMRLLAPDDAADLAQEVPEPERPALLSLLDPPSRKEVTALMAYNEDDAGGLMSPRFVRVRPTMSVDEAISYVRKQAPSRTETIYYVYVLDAAQHLEGVVSLRQLLAAPATQNVREVMETDVVTATEEMDQEALSRLIARHDLPAVPVLDPEGRMKGIVTADDILDVVEEEATEDIQKIGGTEALGEPYLQIALHRMVEKRAGWLAILFVGEMLTATALGYFQTEIHQAVVLALFMPLIISSGGNSGSQATTLVIRAMALGEVRLRDVLRVGRREVAAGFLLGIILGIIGLTRISVWHAAFGSYGPDWFYVALTVSISLVGVVLWGTLMGAMLPFALRSLGFDPASASAPFVATLVDVSGLIIYFSVAHVVLAGRLL